ncbi:hypothetical protein GGU11DRAFT_693239, partial [Lentinula aff. detonsa]
MGRINAPLAYRATELLTGNAPYLSEDGSDAEDIMHPDRFCVYQISETEHLIMDTAYFDVEYRVRTNDLKNPDFRLVEWFCNERGETAAELEGLRYGLASPMGNARGKAVAEILNGTSSYPGDYI